MSNQRDVECMSHALRLAKKGLYTTRPNPNVGCVIVRSNGDIVGEGYHQYAGGPHAEIHALQQAGEHANGATAYVSLEPCCHQGKTGPCTTALIDAGIKKVVIATRDPNPLVAGKGVEELIQHGITVEENVLSQESNELNRGFVKRMKHDLSWVTAKVASSMDGRTALNNGESKWITGEHARLDVQKQRAKYDAIMTGIGTVIADDPSLNVRATKSELGIEHEPLQPVRIIIDPNLKMPKHAKMLKLPGETIIFTSNDNYSESSEKEFGCKLVPMNCQNGKFDMYEIFAYLAKLNINNVLIEAGQSLLAELLEKKHIDELIHYMAPTLMGNPSKGMFDINEITDMSKCIQLEHKDIRQIGKDIRVTSLINY